MNFLELLKSHFLLMDGAMGTYYAQLYPTEESISEFANITHPERIERIHSEYIAAGAQILRTNSFASHAEGLTGLPLHQTNDRQATLQIIYNNVFQAYKIAQKAALCTDEKIWIVGDIGPIPANSTVSDDEILAQLKTMLDALLDAGAEIILFETFADFEYILPAIQYIREQVIERQLALSPVIMVSFCLNKFGCTKAGISATSLLKTAADSGIIDVVGFNCGVGSAHMKSILQKLDFGNMLISIVPNSGYPDVVRNRNIYQNNVGYFCENMVEIASMGINILGGCCGTTPQYIHELKKQLQLHFSVNENLGKLRHHLSLSDADKSIDKSSNDFLNKLNAGKKVIAVELDPPQNGNADKIIQASALLKQAGADIITFSDSPMGKMRADSIASSVLVNQQTDIATMPHICCRDRNVISMGGAFLGAHMNGIRNMLIVTGDPVPSGEKSTTTSVYDFNSFRLMNYFKQLNIEYFADDPIIYGGALNHNRPNIDVEIDRMHKKCSAGADYFFTQPIYSDDDVKRIKYIKTKINTKIICGIMPLVNYRNAMFVKNEISGIQVPDEIIMRYNKDMSREEGEQTGITIALEIIKKLQDISDGYYFMVPFNRASMICKIIEKIPCSVENVE